MARHTAIILLVAILPLSLAGLGKPGQKLPPRGSQPERFFTSFGYGFCFPSYKSINFVLQRYNQTRPLLQQPMEPIRYLGGFFIAIGSANDAYMLEFTYAQRRAGAQGIEEQQGYTITRDIVLRDNKLSAGAAAKFYSKKRFIYYAGAAVSVGYQNIYTRSYRSIDEIKQPIKTVGSGNLQLGLTLFAPIHFLLDKGGRLRLVARPYISFEFLAAYAGDLNKTINPATYINDNNAGLYNRPWGAGMQLQFCIML